MFSKKSEKSESPKVVPKSTTDGSILSRNRWGSKMDKSENIEMWQRITEHSIMGHGFIRKAAVVNLVDGTLLGYSPPEFNPTVDQITNLAVLMHRPSESNALTEGIHLADDIFWYKNAKIGHTLCGTSDGGSTRLYIVGGLKKAVVSVFDKQHKEQAEKLINELVEFFRQNYTF